MSLPTRNGVLNRTAADPNAPTGIRIRALKELDLPYRSTLIRIIRDPRASSKLKGLASLLYAQLEERRTKRRALSQQSASPTTATNPLGLKQ